MNRALLCSSKRYVIGVSGGSDSMALLSMCVNEKIDVIVAHVNYGKRKTSDRDYEIVRDFCRKHHLIMECLTPVKEEKGNFQAWARAQRYRFFKMLCDTYQADAVLIAHHQDDVLETYIMQKERKSIPLHWGIKESTRYDGLTILRPLLGISKKELESYCQQHDIVYGEDESNYSKAYKRNRIRHEIVAGLSVTDRQLLLAEMQERNSELSFSQNNTIQAYNASFLPFDETMYRHFPQTIRTEALRMYLLAQQVDARHYTKKFLKELDGILIKEKSCEVHLYESVYLIKSYGTLEVFDKRLSEYCTVLPELKYLKTRHFALMADGPSVSGVSVGIEDFPLTIRNWRQSDRIQLRFGTKRVNRWFIDRKIPLHQRYQWPIVLNRNDEVILVPGIGCNIAHFSNNPNLFVLKLF